jgi:reactive intermediate/imine deaminase
VSLRSYKGGLAVKFISTESAPTARGHYSQAVVHDGIVYVAGQLPIVANEPDRRLASFEDQARRVIDNVIAILEASGSGRDLVLKSTVYIADVSHWPAFNAIYAERFGSHKPARTVVPVAALHYGYLVEMDAIAAVRGAGAG